MAIFNSCSIAMLVYQRVCGMMICGDEHLPDGQNDWTVDGSIIWASNQSQNQQPVGKYRHREDPKIMWFAVDHKNPLWCYHYEWAEYDSSRQGALTAESDQWVDRYARMSKLLCNKIIKCLQVSPLLSNCNSLWIRLCLHGISTRLVPRRTASHSSTAFQDKAHATAAEAQQTRAEAGASQSSQTRKREASSEEDSSSKRWRKMGVFDAPLFCYFMLFCCSLDG